MSARRIALLLAFSCIPATAQDILAPEQEQTMAVGSGVICDTLQRAKQFATYRSDGKDTDVALQMVNNEVGGACSFGLVVFTGGAPVAELSVSGRPVSVVEITVHAFNYGSIWKAVPDVVRYTVVLENGRTA
jgi:hypothetical protein